MHFLHSARQSIPAGTRAADRGRECPGRRPNRGHQRLWNQACRVERRDPPRLPHTANHRVFVERENSRPTAFGHHSFATGGSVWLLIAGRGRFRLPVFQQFFAFAITQPQKHAGGCNGFVLGHRRAKPRMALSDKDQALRRIHVSMATAHAFSDFGRQFEAKFAYTVTCARAVETSCCAMLCGEYRHRSRIGWLLSVACGFLCRRGRARLRADSPWNRLGSNFFRVIFIPGFCGNEFRGIQFVSGAAAKSSRLAVPHPGIFVDDPDQHSGTVLGSCFIDRLLHRTARDLVAGSEAASEGIDARFSPVANAPDHDLQTFGRKPECVAEAILGQHVDQQRFQAFRKARGADLSNPGKGRRQRVFSVVSVVRIAVCCRCCCH